MMTVKSSLRRFTPIPLHVNLFSIDDVESIIANQGFNIIESEQTFDGMTASFIVARKETN
jgi:hypothetical protein